ncbi:lon protease homolog, mitochondrial-like isoform X2 [Panicum virgatum]|uniref:lon protease homolog, mitochondrial-like isoform X2 n=1 Tax=Panicum virgatum TaxID=38727 RepID=UPI0019D5CC40|nr:lon protease homolog, mitochondrial-like isoform X2 [Panicum virgatum]
MLRATATAGFPARLAAKRPRVATAATRVVVAGAEVRSMLFRTLRCGPVPVPRKKACFCSNSDAGSGPEAAEGAESTGPEEGEGENASSAIVPAAFRPEDCHTVIALPLLQRPLFPGFYMPIHVKDPKLLQALVENSKRSGPYAGAFLVKDDEGTNPNAVTNSESDNSIHDLKGKELLKRLHDVGTLAQITRIQGDLVVLLGHHRVQITEMVAEDPLTVKVDHLKEMPYDKDDDVIKATSFEVISTLRDVLKTNTLWKDQVQTYTQHMGDFNYPRLADFGAAISGANKLLCQEVLEELDVCKRLKLTLQLVKRELEISKLQESIAKTIEEKVTGEQRRYWLNELLKAIKKELGLETDDKTALSEKFRERIEAKKDKCPPHVLQVIEEELTKLQLLEASSSEFSVTRNYLDWLTAVPWGDYSDENFDVHHAQCILDEDHYGLADVKERILEFIAVGKLRGSSQGKIICLSGPPGVGKTSIGHSIARALNRKFYRFSVGGLADVAEIKGHRRTYVGAMPGKMVQCLKSVGTANPLVLIDEIDKVLFVCTANVIEMIPNPLLDRMEIISIAGYITDEKMHIARDYLEKNTREASGIKPELVEVTDDALLALIENYCREAGVRNLQKHIEKIYRKVALKLVRQGVSNEPPRDITIVEANEGLAGFDVAIKVEDENSRNSLAKDVSVDVNPIDSSLENINAVPLTTESEVGHNEHSNEAPIENFLEETTKVFNTSSAPEANRSAQRTTEALADKSVEKVIVNASNLGDFVGKPIF